jgi:hypothetical protein
LKGTLNVEDGRFVLRFERWLAHLPRKTGGRLAPEVANPLRLSSVHGKLPVGLLKGRQS